MHPETAPLWMQFAFGFAGVVAGTGVSWGYLKARVDGLEKWKAEHRADHIELDRQLREHGEDISSLKTEVFGRGAAGGR